jgi:hypothetical protein
MPAQRNKRPSVFIVALIARDAVLPIIVGYWFDDSIFTKTGKLSAPGR